MNIFAVVYEIGHLIQDNLIYYSISREKFGIAASHIM